MVLKGKPTPPKKRISSSGSSSKTALKNAGTAKKQAVAAAIAASSPDPSVLRLDGQGTVTTATTKAAKRASKRRELLSQAPSSSSSSSLPALPPHTMSKSALRRAKRKTKEQLIGMGPQGKMDDLNDAMKEVEEMLEEDEMELEERRQREGKIGAVKGAHVDAGGSGQAAGSGVLTAKKKRKMLALEQTRQKAILNDLKKVDTPFAALRQHAQNSLIFDQ